MVWGLVEPTGYGDYFPGGDYIGWEEALSRYFNEELTAEQQAEFDNRDIRFMRITSLKFTEDKGQLAPHEIPDEFRLRETHKSLGALIGLGERHLAVNETLKEIIESFEPGVHQFWPLRITMPKGREYPVPYYGLRIGTFLDSFVPERSEGFHSSSEITTYYANNDTKKGYASLCVAESVVAGSHLWRERWLRSPKILLSDELMTVIERRALRIPKHHQLKVI